jgi:N-methylhydantoinase B
MSPVQPDPVTFEVIWHRLIDIAEEMGIKYMRTSGSPVLVGAYDASTAIMLPDGRLVAMGPYITTQGHVQRLIVEATVRLRSEAPGIRPGDMFICNDPYLGATHQPDVVTVAPLMIGDRLVGWVGSSGHWLDIGGSEPGGFAVSATSVFDEGLRLPPTKLVEGGVVREDIVQLIMAQIREPLAEFDLRGQVAANQWGLVRLAELMSEYGEETVTSVMEASITYVKSRVQRRLAELPDGVWREVQYLDHDGRSANLRPIVCTVTKRGTALAVDFTGSAPQVRGFANCTYGGLRAATVSAVGIALGYDLPWNDGLAESVELIAPPGTVVTAEYPTPVSLSTISAIIVTLNLVMTTFSKMLLLSPNHRSEAMAGWCGTSLGISVSSMSPSGGASVLSEASHFAGGCGARTYADGVDTGGIIINTTANIPSIEVTEAEYPVLYLFRRQLIDSGGPGRFRGGRSAGVALVPYGQDVVAETTFAGVGAEVANGTGLGGGLPGATVRYLRVADGVPGSQPPWSGVPTDTDEFPASVAVLPINTSHDPIPARTIEYHNWQGGGGYGDPLDRDPDRVAEDVRWSAVSPEQAVEIYGVVIDSSGRASAADTNEQRTQMTKQRLTSGGSRWSAPEDQTWKAAESAFGSASSSATVEYGDLVRFDFGADAATCIRCGFQLSAASEDFRTGTLVHDAALHSVGPVRGEGYASGEVRLIRYYCPGCGRQLEAEVSVGPGHSAFLVRPGGAQAGKGAIK